MSVCKKELNGIGINKKNLQMFKVQIKYCFYFQVITPKVDLFWFLPFLVCRFEFLKNSSVIIVRTTITTVTKHLGRATSTSSVLPKAPS